MVKKFLGFLLLAILTLPSTVSADPPTQAQINEALLQLPHVRIMPDNPFYFAVLVKEKISWLICPNPAKKAQFDLTSSGKRLKEVYLLVQKNNFKKSKNVLSSYQKTLEKMTGELEKAKKQGQNITQLLDKTQNSFLTQKIILSQLYAQDGVKNQMGNETLAAQKSLIESAKKLGELRPDIFIPFQEATKSASF